jgi:CHAT domain-containing protein/Tfp pilus assembly protein PilF
MITSTCARLSVLILLLSSVTIAHAAAPPQPLGPAQLKRSKERSALAKRAVELFRRGKMEEWIEVVRQAHAITLELYGLQHPYSAYSLTMLAEHHERQDDLPEALRHRELAVEIWRRLLPETDWHVIDARLALEDCRGLNARSADNRKKVMRSRSLNREMLELYQQGKFNDALKLAREALALREEVLGKKHRDCAESMHNLSLVLQALGQLPQAQQALEQALTIREARLGSAHPATIASLNNLGAISITRGDYPRARVSLERASAGLGELYGKRSSEYAIALNNVSSLHRLLGNNDLALRLIQQAVDIEREIGSEKSAYYVVFLNTLAFQHEQMAHYAKALPLYLRALELRKEVQGEDHPAYAIGLNNLAMFHAELGDYDSALSLFEQARKLRLRTLGETHPLYADSLNNLAFVHSRRGDRRSALPLYEKSLALRKERFGTKHPLYLQNLSNVATVYELMGEFSRALPLYQEVLATREKTLGERHPDSVVSLRNLGNSLNLGGEPEKALPLVERARTLGRTVFGENHPLYADCAWSLAATLAHLAKNAEAEPIQHEALVIAKRHLDDTFSALSERQRIALLTQVRYRLDQYLGIAIAAGIPAERLYDEVLAWKGAVASRQAEERIVRDAPTLAPLLERLRAARARLARLASTPLGSRKADWAVHLGELEKAKETAEIELARASEDYRQLRRVIDAGTVARALPAGTVLLDYLVYHHYRDTIPRGSRRTERRLVAFVLRPGAKPVLRSLGAVQEIDESVFGWRKALQENTSGAVSDRLADRLRERLWAPLEDDVGRPDTILVAADGALNLLPFAALPGRNKGTWLVEESAIAHVTSGRQVVDFAGSSATADGLLALGGLNYGKPGSERAMPALPGTRHEAEQVAEMYRKRFPEGRPPRNLGPKAAKPDLLAELTPAPGKPRLRYLHLATHGFFASPQIANARLEPSDATRSLANNPLLLSGLILANYNMDSEQGSLTAEEVASLDLRGVDLAVLSACETGLGTIRTGEGVMGLQRAFHQAGARTLVTSLWSVSDPATSVLMEEMYRRLWSDKQMTRLEALRQAQLFVLHHPDKVVARAKELRAEMPGVALRGIGKTAVPLPKAGKTATLRSPPAWWAAFVLSGDPGR